MSKPIIEFEIRKWQRKYFIEKDEALNPILKNGKPIILDSWVIVEATTKKGVELQFDVDEHYFDEHILPNVLDDLIHLWRSIAVGNVLFSKREEMLSFLLDEKAQHPELCEP